MRSETLAFIGLYCSDTLSTSTLIILQVQNTSRSPKTDPEITVRSSFEHAIPLL